MKQMTSTSNIQLYTDIQLTLYVNGINELRLLMVHIKIYQDGIYCFILYVHLVKQLRHTYNKRSCSVYQALYHVQYFNMNNITKTTAFRNFWHCVTYNTAF